MTKKLTPNYDKTMWRPGPWDNEPDRFDFVHAGFICFVLRNHSGNWCGYVGLPPEHPLYAVPYNSYDTMPDFDVHGGLTYSGLCDPPICHEPLPDLSDTELWWLGFDTGHYMDDTPSVYFFSSGAGKATYKDMQYTIAETKKLAEQVRNYGPKATTVR